MIKSLAALKTQLPDAILSEFLQMGRVLRCAKKKKKEKERQANKKKRISKINTNK